MTVEDATIRIARPTDNLDALLPFYRDGLGFEVLYAFRGHGDFDGIMLGHPGAPYHLEFTRAHGHAAGRAPTEDNLLLFYLPEPERFDAAVQRMRGAGFSPVRAFNAYWDVKGVTFEDPDGYRIVLQNAAWDV
ncbi:MAG: glyoxalase [Hyphomonas sp. BRH_c22]|uniref:VOC family protein n=1 Tax=Hyphomonas sp. BRH_c22 TaxID=1629710 RepID=UPI0005F23386|nr:VOC family protein [Hyphomonas sp. BRH_c22]KJS35070.1 MAG: glyoxalase [Hyphomonas sp. BRH_c22]